MNRITDVRIKYSKKADNVKIIAAPRLVHPDKHRGAGVTRWIILWAELYHRLNVNQVQ